MHEKWIRSGMFNVTLNGERYFLVVFPTVQSLFYTSVITPAHAWEVSSKRRASLRERGSKKAGIVHRFGFAPRFERIP